ncbi:MAG: hypothetical protein ACR2P4_09255 [Gammaproteobacteria bacterium]
MPNAGESGYNHIITNNRDKRKIHRTMPEKKDATPPARVLPRVLAVLAFAAAAVIGITPDDAAAQDRATIIYSATPTAVVSVRSINHFTPPDSPPELVFIGTTPGIMTVTVFGVTGTVNADGNNFRPLPAGATGILLVTLDIFTNCSIAEGCGGRFGLIGNTPAARLANFITLSGATLSAYAEAFSRYHTDFRSPHLRSIGLLEMFQGEPLLYHLITTGQDEQLGIVLVSFINWAPKGIFDNVVSVGSNAEGLMHRAAINLNTTAISVLLTIHDVGGVPRVNPNRRGTDGRTPLIYLISTGLAGTEGRANATVALSIMLTDARIHLNLGITGNDGKTALDIATERSENPFAAVMINQLVARGATCSENNTSPLCPGGGTGFQPASLPNSVFVIRDDDDLTEPGLVAKLVILSGGGNVIGVLSHPGQNGKLNLKLKTAVIVFPKNPDTPIN